MGPPFRACLEKTLPNCDFLFGNETEALAYAEAVGWETTNVEFIATRLSLVPMHVKGGQSRKRTVVITQGCEPTVVAVNGKVTLHAINKLDSAKIVDTNGAGDAFVGGFLAALSKGKDVAECCKAGNHSASIIIQHSDELDVTVVTPGGVPGVTDNEVALISIITVTNSKDGVVNLGGAVVGFGDDTALVCLEDLGLGVNGNADGSPC